jgi:hypothetical protein
MTLIAAVRYADGVVMCADAQETVGDYRRAVQKISPFETGDYQVMVAGSGHAQLIESFIVCLERSLQLPDVGTDLRAFVASVEGQLAASIGRMWRFAPTQMKISGSSCLLGRSPRQQKKVTFGPQRMFDCEQLATAN